MKRFDVYLVNLDPTQGYEIQKTWPALIISPDEMNRHLGTVLIAPMTTKGEIIQRVPVTFQKNDGQIVLDQIRTVGKRLLIRRLGRINQRTSAKVLQVLQEMCAL